MFSAMFSAQDRDVYKYRSAFYLSRLYNISDSGVQKHKKREFMAAALLSPP